MLPRFPGLVPVLFRRGLLFARLRFACGCRRRRRQQFPHRFDHAAGKGGQRRLHQGMALGGLALGIDRGLGLLLQAGRARLRPRSRRPSAGRSIPSAARPGDWRDWSAPGPRPELDAPRLEMHEMHVAQRLVRRIRSPCGIGQGHDIEKLSGARLWTAGSAWRRLGAGRGLSSMATAARLAAGAATLCHGHGRGARGAGRSRGRRGRRAGGRGAAGRTGLQQTAAPARPAAACRRHGSGGSAPSRRPAGARVRPGLRPAPSAASASSGSAPKSRGARPARGRAGARSRPPRDRRRPGAGT